MTASGDLDQTDFFLGKSLIDDPYPYFDHIRGISPVWREPHHGVVMVTGYEEACAVFRDTTTFSSCNSVTGPFPGFPVPLEGDDVSDLIEEHRDELPFHDQLPTFDPPKHTAHRGLLMRLLTPKRMKENEEFIWRLADQQIDEFIEHGECEFINEYCSPFTMLVVADLLGVPENDHDLFREQLQSHNRGGALGSSKGESMVHNPLEFLYDQFTAYIEDRRRDPRDDVLTKMALATFPDGSTPEVLDVVRVAANLFAAGQETTVRLLGSALQFISQRPELQDLLRAERHRIPDFIEETLRIESPVKGDFRLARVPTTLGGVDIPAGTTVMIVQGAANRDPRRFDDPAEFRLDRTNSREHLSFGRGIHSCPGGPLARVEAVISIERLLDRMQDIRLSDEVHGPPGARTFDYMPTFILRGVTKLHLEFTAAPRP